MRFYLWGKKIDTTIKRLAWLALIFGSLFLVGCGHKSDLTGKEPLFQNVEQLKEAETVTKKIYQIKTAKGNFILIQKIESNQITEFQFPVPNSDFEVIIPHETANKPKNHELHREAIWNKNDENYYLRLAEKSLKNSDQEKALYFINKALILNNLFLKAYLFKGGIYYATGKYRLAREEYQTALALSPDNKEIQNILQYLNSQIEK